MKNKLARRLKYMKNAIKTQDLVEIIKAIGLFKRMVMADDKSSKFIYHVELPKLQSWIELECDTDNFSIPSLSFPGGNILLQKQVVAIPINPELDELRSIFLENKDKFIKCAQLFSLIENTIKQLYSLERLRQEKLRGIETSGQRYFNGN